jgi:hypothetical protein
LSRIQKHERTKVLEEYQYLQLPISIEDENNNTNTQDAYHHLNPNDIPVLAATYAHAIDPNQSGVYDKWNSMKEFNCLALRSNFKPYQQKTWYEAEPDSSEIEDSDQDSINEDILFSQEQPYETPTQVNYG